MTPITLDQTYFSGILEYITEDGRISPRRMPENLMGFDKYMKSCSAGIRILLETDSPRLKLEQMFYKRDSVDFTGTTSVVVDHGVPVTFNAPAPPHEKGGDTFAFEMELPGDGLMHRVEIWLPFGRRTAITGLYLAENARVKPAAPEEKTILFLGDSITQGFFGQGIRTWASLFAHSRKANLVNLGIGGAVQTAFRYVARHDFDYAVKVDGDGQHPIDQIAGLLAPLKEGKADMVIGSRFIEKEGFQSTFCRRLGINVFRWLNSLLIRQTVTDNTSGFRAYNRQALCFAEDNYPAFDYPEPEEVILMVKNGFRIMEVPSVMESRQGGVSSISPLKAVYYMLKVCFAVLMAAMRAPVRKKGC